jgi:sterol desaturase/sphingolipid hydroxylase (fatty acid hydroxylase superfamily)
VPLLQAVAVYGLLGLAAPALKGSLDVSPVAAFLLNFVAVDYLYYWNHRLLHCDYLWGAHAIHHTPEQVDVFVTSRNTLWSPLLIVYVWANGFFLFVLKEPAAYLLAASVTASLDLWRHTTFAPRAGSFLHRVMRLLLITPREHAWHHSTLRAEANFGANLCVWDRIHKTYFTSSESPDSFGIKSDLDFKRKLMFPFRKFSL